MNVAMVNTSARRGGAARVARDLASGLMQAGVRVTLYHADDAAEAGVERGERRLGSRSLNALLARTTGRPVAVDFGFAGSVTAAERDAQVLHVHNLHGYYLDFPRLLAAFAQRPVVWTWHDMWGATGRCAFAGPCTGYQTGCQKCPDLSTYPAAWVDRAGGWWREKRRLFSAMPNLHVVAPSRWLADVALGMGLAPAQVSVIRNPLDLAGFSPLEPRQARRALGLDPDLQYLLFIADNCEDERKGFRDFAELLERTGRPGLVVGQPPKRFKVPATYVGRLQDRARLAQCYSAAALTVVPSQADNVPNTVLESMACGTPVVAYDVGGIAEQLPERSPGLVAPGDVAGLCAAVEASLERPIDGLAEHAHRFAGLDAAVTEYRSLYERLLGARCHRLNGVGSGA